VPTYEFLFYFLDGKRRIPGIVQTNRVFQSTGCGSIRKTIRLCFYTEFDYHSVYLEIEGRTNKKKKK